ncbi:MAG: GAF domain-containing sensor histidine kinase [Actinobacteria bacterium]|nr:GAF domain-containing sensor histidine kinase [Actinomycetota bacterium]
MTEINLGIKILEELREPLSKLDGIRGGGEMWFVLPSRFIKDAVSKEPPIKYPAPPAEVTDFVEKFLQEHTGDLFIIEQGDKKYSLPSGLLKDKTMVVMPVLYSPAIECCENADCLYEEWKANAASVVSCFEVQLNKAGCCGKRSGKVPGEEKECTECPLFPFVCILVMLKDEVTEYDHMILELAREKALCSVERTRIELESKRKRELEETVSKLLDSMSGTLEFEKRMKILLGFIMGIVTADSGSIMIFKDLGEELRLSAWTSVPGNPGHGDPPNALLSAASRVVQSGQPLLLRGDRTDKDGVEASSISLPLLSRGKVVGALHLSSVDPHRFLCQADMIVMEEVARLAGMGIENAFMFARMEENDKLHRMLLTKMINAQEDERKRIASDIHDDTIQALISSFYRMEGVEMLVKSGRYDEAKEELENTKFSLQKNITGMRRLLFDLRPSILDDAGFAPALENYLNRMEDEYGIRYFFYVDEGLDRLKPTTEVTLYRLAQEILTNVRKHSKATEVVVKIIRRGGTIELTVRDNGGGFNVEEVLNEKSFEEHFGLKSVMERTELAGGGVKIWAQPGEGTEVSITIPEEI